MQMKLGDRVLAQVGMGLAAAVIATSGLRAQAQDGPPPGMAPHRPPMERAMGLGGPGGMHGDHGRWWNDAKAIEKYKLTDTQRKAMDDIYQQHRLTLIDLHATLEKQELAMEPLIRADQPDEGKVLSQIDRVAQARAELEKANARMLLGIRKELTPEQWKQMEADRAARRDAQGAPGAEHHWRGGQRGPAGSGPGSGPGSGLGSGLGPVPNAQGGPGPNGDGPPPPGEDR